MHESKTGRKVDKQSERKEKAGKTKVKQDSKTRSNRSIKLNTDNDSNNRVIKSRTVHCSRFLFATVTHTHGIKENTKDFQCSLFLKSQSSCSDSVCLLFANKHT